MHEKFEEYIRDRADCRHFVQFSQHTVIILLTEIDRLRGIVEGLAERVAAQSALLSQRAEREAVAVDDGGDIGDWWELGGEG